MNSKFWMTFVVQIDLVQYTGIDSLVLWELICFCFFIDGSSNWFGTVHVRLVRKFQTVPCYPEIFKIYLCLVVLRKLPPSQPAPCYPKIAMHAKTPTSCEIPTRKMPMIPLNWKNRLGQIGGGTFVTYPTFQTSVSLSNGSPSHPICLHRGRENPWNPTPSSVRHPTGASSPTTSSTTTPRRPSSTAMDEDSLSISASRWFSYPVLHFQGAALMFPSPFMPPPFPHCRLHLHHQKSIIITNSSDEAEA